MTKTTTNIAKLNEDIAYLEGAISDTISEIRFFEDRAEELAKEIKRVANRANIDTRELRQLIDRHDTALGAANYHQEWLAKYQSELNSAHGKLRREERKAERETEYEPVILTGFTVEYDGYIVNGVQFKTLAEADAYIVEKGLTLPDDEREAFEIHEWPDGTWLGIRCREPESEMSELPIGGERPTAAEFCASFNSVPLSHLRFQDKGGNAIDEALHEDAEVIRVEKEHGTGAVYVTLDVEPEAEFCFEDFEVVSKDEILAMDCNYNIEGERAYRLLRGTDSCIISFAQGEWCAEYIHWYYDANGEMVEDYLEDFFGDAPYKVCDKASAYAVKVAELIKAEGRD